MNLLIVSAHRCFVDGSFGALSNCHFDVSTFFKRSLFSMTHSRVKVIKPIYFFKCYDCFFIVEFLSDNCLLIVVAIMNDIWFLRIDGSLVFARS